MYSGTVDGMTINDGFFELQADDNNALQTALLTHPAVESIKEEDDKLYVYLKSALSATELNTFLFEQNICLSYLVKRKNSLEEQFLELTNKKNSP